MGFFNRKQKKYTLAEAIKQLKKEGFEKYIPVPVEPTNPHTRYWLRIDENLLKQVPHVETPFQEKRRKMMEEICVDEDFKNRTDNIIRSHSSKPGRVIYNNYQSAKNYQENYGQR